MILFKQPEDLQLLLSSDPAFPFIKELVESLIEAYTWDGHPYLPEAYGFVSLIQDGDGDRVLHEIWDDWTLLDIPWEGICLQEVNGHRFYLCIFLANDDFGISFVIPDEPWVKGKLRAVINDNLDPEPV